MNQKQQQIEELSKKFLEDAITILGTCNVEITFKRCNRKDILQMAADLDDPDYTIGWYSEDVLSGHAGWWASPPIQDNEINICYDFD